MSIDASQADWFADTFHQLVANVELALRGKTLPVRLAVTTMLTGGHLLLEDVPGTGKTMLARALAATVQGSHSRIQFTPDLLPSDVTGVTIYNQASQAFEFHRGPVFANVTLADEINRASPKTQSALLEVMQEGRITVDGVSHALPRPFIVIATMNPVEQAGTYDLPEAQLDRFLMRTTLGYPDRETTIELLAEAGTQDRVDRVAPLITADAVAQMEELARNVHVDPSILGYVTDLAEGTRTHDATSLGVSVRGCLSLVRAAKTWAASVGRTHVLPDDVKELVVPVLAHRILVTGDAAFAGTTPGDVLAEVVDRVAAPIGAAA